MLSKPASAAGYCGFIASGSRASGNHQLRYHLLLAGTTYHGAAVEQLIMCPQRLLIIPKQALFEVVTGTSSAYLGPAADSPTAVLFVFGNVGFDHSDVTKCEHLLEFVNCVIAPINILRPIASRAQSIRRSASG